MGDESDGWLLFARAFAGAVCGIRVVAGLAGGEAFDGAIAGLGALGAVSLTFVANRLAG
ncbi:MAG: hypothetical protein ABMB14_36455 [Myxococcota bacterium]